MPEKSAELLAKMGVGEADTSHALDRLVEREPVRAGDPLFPRLLELPPAIAEALAVANAAAGARRVHRTDRRRDPHHPAHRVRRLREGGAPRRRDRVRRAAPERRH